LKNKPFFQGHRPQIEGATGIERLKKTDYDYDNDNEHLVMAWQKWGQRLHKNAEIKDCAIFEKRFMENKGPHFNQAHVNGGVNMFIYNQQLEALIRYKPGKNEMMISLYLNVTPDANTLTTLNSMIHTTRNAVKERLDKDAMQAVEDVFSKIENHVKNNLQRLKNTRLVVIFADTAGFWQEYQLPVSLPGQMVVEPDPYIRPLSTLLYEFDRYLVLVADSRHARLFSLCLRNFEEHPDILIESDVPDRVKASVSMSKGGGKGGAAAKVYQGIGDEKRKSHIKDHIHRHVKHITDKAFDYFKEKNVTRLIIATPDDKIRPWLKDHLHNYLKDRLAGEFNAQPSYSDNDLKQLAIDAASEYEKINENRIIDTLFEKNRPGDLAVLGVDPVIQALRKGQVHTLVVEHDYTRSGFLCRNDHTLSSLSESCPLCETPMEETGDLLDEMVEEAIMHNSEVKHIFSKHEKFQKYHVGALLRFTV